MQEDGPDALEEVTNSNMLPAGKKLRSDDPNHKSSEQIRWGAEGCTRILKHSFDTDSGRGGFVVEAIVYSPQPCFAGIEQGLSNQEAPAKPWCNNVDCSTPYPCQPLTLLSGVRSRSRC